MKLILTLAGVLLSSFIIFSQVAVTVSGILKSKSQKRALTFVNVLIKTMADSVFVFGTITDEEGRFSISGIQPA